MLEVVEHQEHIPLADRRHHGVGANLLSGGQRRCVGGDGPCRQIEQGRPEKGRGRPLVREEPFNLLP